MTPQRHTHTVVLRSVLAAGVMAGTLLALQTGWRARQRRGCRFARRLAGWDDSRG